MIDHCKQISINSRIDEQSVVYPQMEYYMAKKKEKTNNTCNVKDDSHRFL